MLDILQDLYNAVCGFVVGDALGVPYEFKKRDTFVCDTMRASTFKDSHFPLPLGSWSDDTSMMLCVLDALSVKFRDEQQEKPPQTQKQIDEYQTNIRRKIYKKFRKNCIQWMLFGKYTNHFYRIPYDIGNACRRGIFAMMFGFKNKKANNIKANGNGGLMRIFPIAFLEENNQEKIMQYIQLFNSCSHNHNVSNVGCLLYILLIKELRKTSNIITALHRTVNIIDEKYKIPEYNKIWNLSILDELRDNIKSTGYIVDTLEAVIWCCSRPNVYGYKSDVLCAVNLGGDTDTIAALVGAIDGVRYKSIPQDWLKNTRKERMLQNLCLNVNRKMV